MRRILPALKNICAVGFGKDLNYILDDNGGIIEAVKSHDVLYDELKDRIALTQTGYADCEEFDEIIALLFEPEDIPIVTHINTGLILVEELAEKVGLKLDVCIERLDDMAYRGLIVDIMIDGTRFVMFPEYVVGWYEFTLFHFLVRGEEFFKNETKRIGVDPFELMKIYHAYTDMYTYDFVDKDVQTLRTAPCDIDPAHVDQVVDFETAVGILEKTERIGLLECICKKHEEAMGRKIPEDMPIKHCFILNLVDTAFKTGIAEPIETEAAIEILKDVQSKGHVSFCENNAEPFFMCSCHKEWCGVFTRIHRMPINRDRVVMKSQFEPIFDNNKCISCGHCVDICPMEVLEMIEIETGKGKKKRKVARLIPEYENLCIGCLVCQYNCKAKDKAITPKKRDNPPYIPEDMIDLKVRQAFERGKLNTLIFDDPANCTHKVMRKVVKYIEDNPFSNTIKNIEPLKSKFLDAFVKATRKRFNEYIGK